MASGVLLDTHVLQWWWCSPGLLSARVLRQLKDREQLVVVSAVSWLELSVALGGIAPPTGQPATDVAELLRHMPQALADEGFTVLPVQLCHLQRAARLRGPHEGWSGWIDRLLVAQAQQEGLQLISLDPALAGWGEPLLW